MPTLRLSLLTLTCVSLLAVGQAQEPTAAKPADRLLPAAPPGLLKNLKARCIGPAAMSGRVLDLAVDPRRPATFYAATASGGLWKTTSNGVTWNCVFEKENTCSVGAVALAPSNPEIIYLGTGEENARNSVTWGDGVYKSVDGGQTWRHLGLADTHHIGAICVHPTNPNVVYVAALGHFWGPNEERGVYKSVDGGVSWMAAKYLGPDTGFVDLIMDPKDPDTLWAAAQTVRRDAFSGGDPATQFSEQAGIYKTKDGGRTWRKVTQGLPTAKAGRIGLCQWAKDSQVLFAVYQTEKTNIRQVAGQPASRTPGDVEVGGVFRSDDGGDSWKKLNDLCPRPFYFSKIRVDPTTDQRLFVLGIPLFRSDDGGKTFISGAPRVHSDHHALWIDPANPEHLIAGCDGGVYTSYDLGKTWDHCVNLPVSQVYGVAVDQRRPYWVYCGLQDNGSWGGPSQTRVAGGIANHNWLRVGGGDGFQCAVDPTDWTCLYVESQYGAFARLNLATGERKNLRPRHPYDKPVRFNWNAPMHLSPHNPKTVYYGGNYLFRSVNRGDDWQLISADLTRGDRGSLTTIAESPALPGILWTGSDDGRLHLSTEGGVSWVDLSDKLPVPPQRMISRVEPSRTNSGTCYVAVDRHRNDDTKPYLFRTTDYGKTWTPLHDSLPQNGSVQVIREDPKNPNLLWCGTEFGLFVSINAGQNWHKIDAGLPTVAVHDLVIHPRDAELVIGTHGRGVWIMDIYPLQQLAKETLSAKAYLFEVKPTVAFHRLPGPNATGWRHFVQPNPAQGATISYWLAENQPEVKTNADRDEGNKTYAEVKLTIHDVLGNELAELRGSGEAGLHFVTWNLRKRVASEGRPAQREAEEGEEGGTRPGGGTPQGTRPQSTRPQGTRPQASRPQGTAPRPTAPQPSNPQGRAEGGSGYTQRQQPRPPATAAVPPGEYVVRFTHGGKTQQRSFRVLADDGASNSAMTTDDDGDDD